MQIRTFSLLTGLAALGLSAQAQISFSSGGSLTAWNGTPTYTSLANGTALSGATTGQGDATLAGTAGTFGGMAETFTPSSSFTLGSIDILLSVNNVTDSTYQLNLYDLGPSGTAPSVSSSTATFTSGTSLFSANSISSFSTTSGEVQGTFTLPTVDQVALSAGEEYALALWTPEADGAAGVTWFRGSTADPGGQMFSNGNDASTAWATLAGNGQAGGAPRTGALALYPVAAPEPTSLALLGLGGLAGAFMRRRKV